MSTALPVTELELRYMRPKRFSVPAKLAGMELSRSGRAVHTDRYFDAADEDGSPILQKQNCSLRVRQQSARVGVVAQAEEAAAAGHHEEEGGGEEDWLGCWGLKG